MNVAVTPEWCAPVQTSASLVRLVLTEFFVGKVILLTVSVTKSLIAKLRYGDPLAAHAVACMSSGA